MKYRYIRWFEDLASDDVPVVGGKNASLGEMIGTLQDKGIRVPGGFATTAEAYWRYLQENDIGEGIKSVLEEMQSGRMPLEDVGQSVRAMFLGGLFPEDIANEIRSAYRELSQRYQTDCISIAARSSATAEDLPQASFAGQQETFLNVSGETAVLDACRRCYASLFTDRAISYREQNRFDHMKVALSVGVQKMVRSDLAGAGVMFSIDTETGFPNVVVINAGWGLGENVVKGTINPDEYRVFKPVLRNESLVPIIEKNIGNKRIKMIYSSNGDETTMNVETTEKERDSPVLADAEILQLARWACDIEEHYGRPMDMEWAKDGETGEISIVQARPETVQSRLQATSLKTYRLQETGKRLLEGLAIGQAIVAGKVSVMLDPEELERFETGSILVTEMTDPDWGPVLKRAAGVVTDSGGRTSHAAIVSREMGLPAIVGTGNATKVLKHGQEVTLSCAEGEEGFVYEGRLWYEETEVDLENMPETRTHIMMNIANPDGAFRWWRLPAQGIGLARMEFIINGLIKIHPMALVHFDKLEDESARRQIEEITRRYKDKTGYFVDNLASGIARIAASQYPHPVIVRMSDFKTNEYANLIGGKQFEPEEENPMLGFRGASRYYNDRYRQGFALECHALKRAREEMGLDNIVVMIPFCRTLEEADQVLRVMAEDGLERGVNGLKVYVMAEIPSNIILAEEFTERFDGFSIGSNDLTQLTLGIDRDSAELKELFDESNEAVKRMIQELIEKAHRSGTPVGICGEAPSNKPEFATFLVEAGIDSISLNPDSVVGVKRRVAEVEKSLQR